MEGPKRKEYLDIPIIQKEPPHIKMTTTNSVNFDDSKVPASSSLSFKR